LEPASVVCHLPFEPGHDFFLHLIDIAVIVALIQGWDETPMFHFQSQWSPENNFFPVRSA
jgi:hypothetical protein